MVDEIISVSENVVKMVHGSYPEQVDFDIYRGDSWSFTIIGVNKDGTPFDWAAAENLSMNFRLGHPLNPNVAVDLDADQNFVLGKTDINQPEFDELHLIDPGGVLFSDNHAPLFYHDFQYEVSGSPFTGIKGLAHLEFDTTRG